MSIRVLTVADVFFHDAPGGLGRVAWDVAKAMARRGHHVGLLAGDRSATARNGFVREELIENVRVFRYPKPTMSRLDPLRDLKQIHDATVALRATLELCPSDVLHCHSIFTAHAARTGAPGIPVLQTVHSPAIQELSYNWALNGVVGRFTDLFGRPRVRHLERQAMAAASRRHALSRFTVAQMQAEYRTGPQDYDVIPHWADSAWFRTVSKAEARRRLGWPAEERILFTVRQLRHRYGIDTAIEAVAPLANAAQCRFFIGGEGEDRHYLEALVSRHDAGKRIHLLGRISDHQLRLAYQAADVFLLPTRALECFGLIILEALACGLPVIGTKVGAIPENLEPILPHAIVPPDDPIALRQTIEAFLDGSLAMPHGADLVAHVRQHFNEDEIVSRYERLFADALGR